MHSVSVILASYNQPRCLALVLEGLARQRGVAFDVVVADDGSDADTFALLEAFAARRAFPVTVTTQPDEGFRKARALNNAVRASHGEQLVFLDGDCIPFADFLAVHAAAYERGGYAVGGYLHLTLEQSRALTPQAVARGEHEHLPSPAERRRLRTMHAKNRLYQLLRKPRRPKILGGNVSVARAMLERIDGFDERFDGFSGEDSDLRNRLNNAGARGTSLWDRAFVCHLDHALDERRCRPYVLRTSNRDVIHENRTAVRTEHGMSA